MIDLSNNNGPVNFHTVRHQAHTLRVYLKRSEGTHFADGDFNHYYAQAHEAGLKVGAYHFARPSRNTPHEEGQYFLRLLPKLTVGNMMRPCLDLEDPDKDPSRAVGAWAVEWIKYVHTHLGRMPIIYGSPSYLQACEFHRMPCALWLASFGRNDGREHPFTVPAPWRLRNVVAHQFASTAKVPGVAGNVDLSRVLRPRQIDVRHLQRR